AAGCCHAPGLILAVRVSICGRPVRRTSMTDTMTEPISTRNLDRYGSTELPWSRPRDILASDTPQADLAFFLATVRPDGRAHSAAYSAPSAGPAPWHVYRLTLHTAVGVATAEPHGATRWDFAH